MATVYELCHKCRGCVSDGANELNGCQCISQGGRVFAATLDDAATLQAIREIEWFALYVSQGRPEEFDTKRMANAMKLSPAFGHGYVNWQTVAKATKILESD